MSSVIFTLYTVEGHLLGDFSAEAAEGAKATGGPQFSVSAAEPVEDAASHDLDLVTLGQQLWEMTVAVGQLAGAIAVVQSLVSLLGRRKKEKPGVTTTVEVVVNGAKITFSGEMTPAEAAERVREFEVAASGRAPGLAPGAKPGTAR